MSMKFTPTCRYGHGDLEVIPRAPENHYWGLMGAHHLPLRVGMSVNKPLSATEASGRIYTVAIYRCSTCGYMELFDDGVRNG